MDGLALPLCDVPAALIEEHGLARCIHERGGERELRFLRRVRSPVLPVWHAGQLKIVPWGCRSGVLPRSRLTWLHTVEAGEWSRYGAESIVVPAALGLQSGVWFRIRQGIRGLLVEEPVMAAYLIVEPASYYYRVMTRCERMPVFVGERI